MNSCEISNNSQLMKKDKTAYLIRQINHSQTITKILLKLIESKCKKDYMRYVVELYGNNNKHPLRKVHYNILQ